jgi:plasmid stabilization system protein ParE
MTYRVEITERAEREMRSAYHWWAENRSKVQADRWYAGMAQAIAGLSGNAKSLSQSRESEHFGIELRDLLFGMAHRPTHRAVFTVRGDRVIVLAIRHLAQQDLAAEDIELQGD